MLSSLILTAALLAGAPEPPSALPSAAPPSAEIYRIIPLENIHGGIVGDFFPHGAPDGVLDALILMDHGGTILVTDFSLFEIDTANLELRLQVAADEDKPAVFRTVYVDEEGRTHEVVTDCRRFSTFRTCAKSHGEALAAMEEIFPPRGTIIQFNEINPRFQEEGEKIVRPNGGVVILPGLIISMLDMQ